MPLRPDGLSEALGKRYVVERELGRGGMATVYLAHDRQNNRQVAIKVLKPELALGEGADRFLREIKIAARLIHPHILPLHDSGNADGLLYYVMPYVEGESLRERLKRETELPIDDALQIAREVAGALGYAHEQGVVHRDVKPANILLTSGGALVADFGIARALEEAGGEDLTKTGIAVGTPAYMSPEQARGDRVDHRADIWALGVLLYEMLAGRRPFGGATDPAVVYSLFNEDPPPISELRPDVPEALESVVRRALDKDAAARFPDMKAMVAAMGSGGMARGTRFSRHVLVGAAALASLVAGAGLASLLRGGGDGASSASSTADAVAPGIAVLPFSVAGSDLEEWREGLATLLSTGLDGAGGLRTISSRTEFVRWGGLERDAAGVDEPASLRIARETGARYAVLGSAVAIGPEVRLVADVFDAENASPLGQRQVEGHPDSVLVLVDKLALGILGVILGRGEGDLPPIDVGSITTASVPAVKAYLQGEVFSRRAQFDEAIEAYTRALAADSTFALAHYHMASALAWRENIQSPSARSHREAALRFADRLPEREAELVRARHATGEQRPEAVDLLNVAVARHPDDAEAWFLLGDAHLHTSALTGPEEADRAFQRAVEIDPGFALYQPHGIELGFNLHADSAIAASRLEQYGETTNRGLYFSAGKLALALAFGSADAREAAIAALETFDLELLPVVVSFLNHPRHWEAQERVLLAIRDRANPSPWRTTAADLLAEGSLWKRGRLDRALEYLAHPAASPVTRVCLPAVARGWGLPVPEDVLLEALSETTREMEEPLHFALACRGYIVADLARRDELAATVTEANRRAALARERGDTDAADRLAAAATELRGYDLWRQGRSTEALPVLGEAREVAWYLGEWPRRMHRKAYWYPNVWQGLIYLEMGRLEEAAPYFRSLWYNPLGNLRLGQIYQAGGDEVSARGELEYFLEAWKDADPTLQSWVDEARAALASGRRGG